MSLKDTGKQLEGLFLYDPEYIVLDRPAGSDSITQYVTPPSGANNFLASGTLQNVSPALSFQLNYYAIGAGGVVLWNVRALYDTQAKVLRFIHSASDSNVIAQEYKIQIKYQFMRGTIL